MPLQDLGPLFPEHKLRFHGGEIDLNLRYRGQPHDHFDANTLLVKAFLAGSLQFTNASIEHVGKGYHLENLSGELRIQNDDVVIPELDMNLNGNLIHLEGRLVGLIPFFFSPTSALQAHVEVSSPEIDFTPFSTPASRKAKDVPVRETDPNPLSKTVFDALDSLQAHFQLNVGKVQFREFESGKISGEVSLDRTKVAIRNMRLEAGGGMMNLNGTLTGLEEHRPDITLDLELEQVDIKDFFLSMDNFGQESITHDNLQGLVDAKIALKARADDNYKVEPASIDGTFYLKVEDGALLDFPGLSDVHNFLVKNRHLEYLHFATLENTFKIVDRQLLIDDFSVISSAVLFKVDGRYHFDTLQLTELLFEVPLRNLFAHGLKPGLEDYFQEHPHGAKILLEMAPNEEGELRVKPVLSRKKHREVGKE